MIDCVQIHFVVFYNNIVLQSMCFLFFQFFFVVDGDIECGEYKRDIYIYILPTF